ncbi:hypothetical protein MMC13_007867 [Lambiella insularis]|nr:hypothetical protein [Lambiella insularis]
MIEPLSVFSAIATSIAILNLIITTAGKLRTSYLEFREAEDRFKLFRLQLITCESAVRDWHQPWNDLSAWTAAAVAAERGNAINALPISLKRKCLFVLFTNEELSEKIGRLQSMIQLRDDKSCYRWSLQHTGAGDHPSQEEFERVLRLNHMRDFMSMWHTLCATQDKGNWALELRLPEILTPEFNIWDFVDEAVIHFTVINGNIFVENRNKSAVSGRLRVCLRKGEPGIVTASSLSEALSAVFDDVDDCGTFVEFADSLIEISWIDSPVVNIQERYRWSLEKILS